MKRLRKDEEFAINIIAKSHCGTWRAGDDPPDAYLDLSSGEVAVEITTLTQQIVKRNATHARMSDDAVGICLIDNLNKQLAAFVPAGFTVGLTMQSPISNPRKTTDDLKIFIQHKLNEGIDITSRFEIDTNHNKVLIQSFPENGNAPRKIWGIITHKGASPDIAFNAGITLVERIQSKSSKLSALSNTIPILLVLINDYWPANADTYRNVFNSISIKHPFEKILLIDKDESISSLYEKVDKY